MTTRPFLSSSELIATFPTAVTSRVKATFERIRQPPNTLLAQSDLLTRITAHKIDRTIDLETFGQLTIQLHEIECFPSSKSKSEFSTRRAHVDRIHLRSEKHRKLNGEESEATDPSDEDSLAFLDLEIRIFSIGNERRNKLR